MQVRVKSVTIQNMEELSQMPSRKDVEETAAEDEIA